MTHNRAGEVSSPEGCWLSCRQAHRSGGCSAPLLPRLCITGQLFYQTWCSPHSQPQPQQEPHGSVPAYRPDPLPPSPGCQGPEVPHPFQLPWPGLEEHSLTVTGFSINSPSRGHHPSQQAPCCPLDARGPFSDPLQSLPASDFPPPSSSSLPTPGLLSCLSISVFLPLPSISPPAPLCAFSQQAPNGKHLFPRALQQSLLLFFSEASQSNPAPSAQSSLPAIPADAKHPPSPQPLRLGDGLTLGLFAHAVCGEDHAVRLVLS